MHFIGCEKAHEVSLTRGLGSAANPMASVLLFKSLSGGAPADPSNPSPETTDMKPEEVTKAIADAEAKAQASAITKLLGMTDVAKAHFSALTTDEARSAFLAKSIDDMNAEATAAKTAVETEKARQESTKAGLGADVAEIVKNALAPVMTELADVKKQLLERTSADVFKTRAQKDFAGHPQGDDFVASVLKSIDGQPEEVRKSMEATLTSACSLAKFAGSQVALKALGVEAAPSGSTSAMEQLKTIAKDLKKTVAEVSEMPEHAHLHQQAMHEG